MLSPIWLTVEISPGSDIKDACRAALLLANQLNVIIWFQFNEVKMLMRPGDNYKNAIKSYHKELQSNRTYKIASDTGERE
jgi:hypothetical protein